MSEAGYVFGGIGCDVLCRRWFVRRCVLEQAEYGIINKQRTTGHRLSGLKVSNRATTEQDQMFVCAARHVYGFERSQLKLCLPSLKYREVCTTTQCH